MKYWEIIANNLTKAAWDFWVYRKRRLTGPDISAAVHKPAGKRFVVRADEKLTAFVELESAIRPCGELVLTGWRDFCQTRRR